MWKWIAGLALVLSVGVAHADTSIRGVNLADTVEVDGQTLHLNGAELRSRFMVRVYVGALYLPERTGDAATALDMDGAKRVHLHMLRAVDRGTMVEALEDGLAANHDRAELRGMRQQSQGFRELFPDLANGDRVDIDFIPGQGTRVAVNDAERGIVEGDAFARAVLTIWLGDSPADARVKRGMLGDY
ncbi:hypothetical protein J2T57_003251 [Natronocella acetinitrilica]|uniref:Chalcone isomerase domain-containing protein n=1 Tax=Natronocella acetinitrilica TaxID=414046 RepID=A0AAE3G956_9GAMM|nr:chalcone isomerase family protein [Natronocella acetinitrilica]MCP1676092.1 hypothetical protein [Natronocella acetinitrilica]